MNNICFIKRTKKQSSKYWVFCFPEMFKTVRGWQVLMFSFWILTSWHILTPYHTPDVWGIWARDMTFIDRSLYETEWKLYVYYLVRSSQDQLSVYGKTWHISPPQPKKKENKIVHFIIISTHNEICNDTLFFIIFI